MVTPSHLKALQALELAMRKGSLKDAADVLAITPAAVGQRIKALEEYLGVALLDRGRAGLEPSPALAAALPHLRTGFAALEAAAGELDLQRGHELHIAATSDFAELWLAPRLETFRAAHPNIRFCINGEGDVPMRLGRVDCEIAYGPLPADELVDLLFHDLVVPIASRGTIERIATLPATDGLEGYPLLHFDFYKDDPAGLSWPRWIAATATPRTAPERGMRFQRITAGIDAVLANSGVGLCGLGLIAEAVQAGTIALPFAASTAIRGEYAFHARYRADASARPHVARFRAWLGEQSRATGAWLGSL